MLNTLGIVQLRQGSAWSTSKIGRKLGGKSLLEWVVRRLTDCQRLDGVIVLLGDSADDRALCDLVPPDVPIFVSGKKDPLARFVAALDEYRAKAAVRVCPDNPFIDPVLVDRLVSTADADRCDYVSYCSSDGRPAALSPLGVFAEWCTAEVLRRADSEANCGSDRDQVTAYIHSRPNRFKVRLIPIPAELDRHDVRLRIDLEEDWEHAQVIYEALGSDEWDWQRIAGLLDHQPALRQRMALLNRGESAV
jgi:spore coat polysaccharide biosynthesis protein SpsF